MTPTIKNCLLSSKHSRTGITTSKVPPLLSMLSRTTRISSISRPQKYSPAGKPSGPSFYHNLILSFASALVSSVPSLTLSLDNGTSTPKRGIVAMPRLTPKISGRCSLKNSFLTHSVLLTVTPKTLSITNPNGSALRTLPNT